MAQDHEAALKFFQRSLQLEPSFTYAYTLAGHENLAMEQFDKSLACYRNAMRLDPRHYNAWWAAGTGALPPAGLQTLTCLGCPEGATCVRGTSAVLP